MGTGSFPGVEIGQGVTQNSAIPLLSLKTFVVCRKGETYQKGGFVLGLLET
jgi:hypothetical protein